MPPFHFFCPGCKQRQWKTITDHGNYKGKLLCCDNCGFTVDFRIVMRYRRIRERDGGQDLHPEPTVKSDEPDPGSEAA